MSKNYFISLDVKIKISGIAYKFGVEYITTMIKYIDILLLLCQYFKTRKNFFLT